MGIYDLWLDLKHKQQLLLPQVFTMTHISFHKLITWLFNNLWLPWKCWVQRATLPFQHQVRVRIETTCGGSFLKCGEIRALWENGDILHTSRKEHTRKFLKGTSIFKRFIARTWSGVTPNMVILRFIQEEMSDIIGDNQKWHSCDYCLSWWHHNRWKQRTR